MAPNSTFFSYFMSLFKNPNKNNSSSAIKTSKTQGPSEVGSSTSSSSNDMKTGTPTDSKPHTMPSLKVQDPPESSEKNNSSSATKTSETQGSEGSSSTSSSSDEMKTGTPTDNKPHTMPSLTVQKRKDPPESSESSNSKRTCRTMECSVALEVLQEVGCTTDFLNSGKVLAWALDPTDPAFSNVHTYVERSQGLGFEHFGKVNVLSILRIMTNLSSSETTLDHDDDPKNKGQLRKMLWHGTIAKNVPSIIEKGLQLPKHNVQADQWFGDGIYFSDNFAYSFDYSIGFCKNVEIFKDNNGRQVVYLFLCDILLGDVYKTYELQYNAPNVKNKKAAEQPGEPKTITVESIHGCGELIPDPQEDQLIQGCIWPLGKIIEDKQAMLLLSELEANEFVVYETKRVIPKFLVKVEVTEIKIFHK